jgi:hypothetical protein
MALIARLLTVVVAALAAATFVCGAAVAAQQPSGMAMSHQAPSAQAPSAQAPSAVTITDGYSITAADMADPTVCDQCVHEGTHEGGHDHCAGLERDAVHGTPSHADSCTGPGRGQPRAAAPQGHPWQGSSRAEAPPRPPDLHLLQRLRV